MKFVANTWVIIIESPLRIFVIKFNCIISLNLAWREVLHEVEILQFQGSNVLLLMVIR